MKPPRNNGKSEVEAAYRTKEALELRAQGHSYREIADIMLLSGPQTAKNIVDRGLQSMQREGADAVLAIELQRLDTEYNRAETNYHRLEKIISVAMPVVDLEASDDDVSAQIKRKAAINTVVATIRAEGEVTKTKQSLSESRRKMLGIDAPDKLKVETDLDKLSDQEMFDRREALLARLKEVHEEEARARESETATPIQ